MASPAQIEANRRNALKSTGPTSPDGKVSSSRNSHRHGLAADVSDGESAYPGFEERLAEWEAEVRPQTSVARAALRRAVAAVFRVEACRTAFEVAIASHRARAGEAWDDDRFAEAAALLGRIGKRPEVVAHQLRTSAHGVALLVQLWDRLAESLEAKQGVWDDSEVATACDLLGIPVHLRSGRLPFDPKGPEVGVLDARRAFVRAELERLNKKLAGPMANLDALNHAIAVRGSLAMLTRPVQLILRYEAAANRVFDRMLALAKTPAEAEAEPGLSSRTERAAREVAHVEASLSRVAPRARPVETRADVASEPAPMARAVARPVADPKLAPPESTTRLNRHQRRARAARARAAG